MNEETNKEEAKAKIEIPAAKNPLTREEADKMSALIKLDIAKYEAEIARVKATEDQALYLIAQSKVALADIERRVANVDYPPAPAKDETKAESGAKAESEVEAK